MAATVSITPTASGDGITYSDAVPLTTSEADVRGGTNAQISTTIPTNFGEAICAIVQLTVSGIVVTNSSYIVMQMDMFDGVWIDLCWCFWNGKQGTAIFVMSNGIAGANAFQQTRQSGEVPVNSSSVQGNGSNQLALGGRIRFVGKAVTSGGSMAAGGVLGQISVTIKYRIQSLR